MKKSLVMFAVTLALAQAPATKDEPKSYPFTPQEQVSIQAFKDVADKLAQEERAIAAERQLLQDRANKLFDEACHRVGAEKCNASIGDTDHAKWSFTAFPTPKPDAPATPKPEEKK